MPPSLDTQCHAARRREIQALRSQFNPEASPDAAVMHLLLGPLFTASEHDATTEWLDLARAVERWPDDVELAWLAFDRCNPGVGCDRAAVVAHLQRIDGENLFAWMPSMTAAHGRGDTHAYAQAMRRAARARAADSRMGTVFLRLRPALASIPLPAVCMRAPGVRNLAATLGRPVDAALMSDADAMAIDAALAIPAMQGLAGCRPERYPAPVIADCRRVLGRLAEGDTLLEQSLALPKLIELADDPISRSAWRERYRRLRWLERFLTEADRIDGFLWRKWAEGEVALLERHARNTGRWPPPANWLPADDRGRALLE